MYYCCINLYTSPQFANSHFNFTAVKIYVVETSFGQLFATMHDELSSTMS